MELAEEVKMLDHWHDVNARYLIDFFSGKTLPPQLGQPAGAILWLSNSDDLKKVLQPVVSQPILTLSPRPVIHYHISLHYLQQVRHYYPITFSPTITSEIEFPLNRKNPHQVVIHPGSGSPQKNFSAHFYKSLATLFLERGFSQVTFILGPAEIEQNVQVDFKDMPFIFSERSTELLKIFETTALFIGNDSGVSHLAGILGVPSIVLYKVTDPTVWGALGRRVCRISGKHEEAVFHQIKDLVEKQKFLGGNITNLSF